MNFTPIDIRKVRSSEIRVIRLIRVWPKEGVIRVLV